MMLRVSYSSKVHVFANVTKKYVANAVWFISPAQLVLNDRVWRLKQVGIYVLTAHKYELRALLASW